MIPMVRQHLSVRFAASSPQGEPLGGVEQSAKPPLEGRWHGVSHDGEVAPLRHPTMDPAFGGVGERVKMKTIYKH